MYHFTRQHSNHFNAPYQVHSNVHSKVHSNVPYQVHSNHYCVTRQRSSHSNQLKCIECTRQHSNHFFHYNFLLFFFILIIDTITDAHPHDLCPPSPNPHTTSLWPSVGYVHMFFGHSFPLLSLSLPPPLC